MIIRKATAEEMLALWGYPDIDSATPTARFFYKNIEIHNAIFWTAEDDGKLIGELYVFFDLEDKDFADGQNTAYLCAFRVSMAYRRHGIGTKLVNAALQELTENGFSSVTIGVEESEEQNIKLYKRLGFLTKIKDCFEDPCAMTEHMNPSPCSPFWLLQKQLNLDNGVSPDKVRLVHMTRKLCHELYRFWAKDLER